MCPSSCTTAASRTSRASYATRPRPPAKAVEQESEEWEEVTQPTGVQDAPVPPAIEHGTRAAAPVVGEAKLFAEAKKGATNKL